MKKKGFTGQSRRESRAKRVDVFKDWQEGKEHEGPGKERWSREASRARPNKSKSKTSELILGEVRDAQIVGMHRRTCELRFEELWDCNSDPEVARYSPTIDLGGESHLTVGDRVEVALESASQEWYVTKVYPRRSKLSRPGPPDREHREQLLAANVDKIVLIGSAADPVFNPGFVERYLMVAQHSQIPLSLVLNKMDLTSDLPESLKELTPFIEKVLFTSAKENRGLEELKEYLGGCSSIFTGQSGVGKSTLIQAMIPGIELDTTVVREKDGKGRHTTTTSTVFSLPDGGKVIDSPGIRGLGFWDLSKTELAWMYPLFIHLVGKCKFQDCKHSQEPGCAVLNALETGTITQRAYDSYRRMLDSLIEERK